MIKGRLNQTSDTYNAANSLFNQLTVYTSNGIFRVKT
jgi:hypothetical protein